MKLQKEKEQPEIPTASMADIAFLLIVFFMLTTVISATKGIEHILPQQDKSDTTQVEREESIYIKINADSTYTVDQKEPRSIRDMGFLKEYVYEKVSRNYKKPIIIHVNPEADYDSMVAVLDTLKQVEEQVAKEGRLPADKGLTISIPTSAELEAWGY